MLGFCLPWAFLDSTGPHDVIDNKTNASADRSPGNCILLILITIFVEHLIYIKLYRALPQLHGGSKSVYSVSFYALMAMA
jgi:hypothetical protein